jgi:arsenate reductase
VTLRTPRPPYEILFLCTGNSARSLMAEAIVNHRHGALFHAHSAGSHPRESAHPLAQHVLQHRGLPTEGLGPKPWDAFADGTPGAPELDFVFTLCDRAAGETCPVWPGRPITAHWGVPDPAAARGTEAERHLAFADAFGRLANRLSILASLPIASLDRRSLKRRLDEIGKAAAPAD